MSKEVFRLGELFCGPGGIACGAHRAVSDDGEKSITHAWANDFDADTCATYTKNICHGDGSSVYCNDVRELDIPSLGPIDAFAYGFPCNSFSNVGEHQGLENDKFGQLYTYGVEVLKCYQPKWFLAENVSGIQSAGEGRHFKIILNDLENAGYTLVTNMYKFEEYGVPQARHRIIIVGIRNDLDAQGIKFKVPSPEPYKDCDITAGTALANIPKNAPNNEVRKLQDKVRERLSYIKPGQNVWQAENLPPELMIKTRTKISQIYRKLDPAKPSYTVTAAGGGGTFMYHWSDEQRELTNRERARLQTFPDDFEFIGNYSSVRKQIGMAVPPKGAEIIIRAILNCFAGIEYPSIEPNLPFEEKWKTDEMKKRGYVNHWFISRQKRNLTSILPALVAYSDACIGKPWNESTQLDLEDVLGERDITEHGSLRARDTEQGGGGTRTLFTQLKDLGLALLDKNRKCRLTSVGTDLVMGKITFVDAMRIQLKRYQYPSGTRWKGSGAISHDLKVHPFQFMFRLMRDERLEKYITMEEMRGIVIHYAKYDTNDCYEDVVSRILRYRGDDKTEYIEDTDKKRYNDIANTFFNYISLTQYAERGFKTIKIRPGKEAEVDAFIEEKPTYINNPEVTFNYQMAYGRGTKARDLREFDKEETLSQKEIRESRIQKEYLLYSITTPISSITPDVVEYITNHTGFDEKEVEGILRKYHQDGSLDDFFASYKQLAYSGKSGATEFEKATCEIFRKLFAMKAEHVGPKGNTPDVFVESEEENFCGIIDNKAYSEGYSISGDHKRVMESEYIPNYKTYGNTTRPLAFFSYLAGKFGKNIDSQLDEIIKDTETNGSAMPVDLFINMAQDYAEKGYTHSFIKDVFSVNREVRLSDFN